MNSNKNVQPMPFFCKCGIRIGDHDAIMRYLQSGPNIRVRCVCRKVATLRNGEVYWLNRHERRENDHSNEPWIPLSTEVVTPASTATTLPASPEEDDIKGERP